MFIFYTIWRWYRLNYTSLLLQIWFLNIPTFAVTESKIMVPYSRLKKSRYGLLRFTVLQYLPSKDNNVASNIIFDKNKNHSIKWGLLRLLSIFERFFSYRRRIIKNWNTNQGRNDNNNKNDKKWCCKEK